MKRQGGMLWGAQGQFWQGQAGLCGVRGDIYRTLARNCELSIMGHRPFQTVALYCQMQASSCDMQRHFCQMLATFLK
jgi:hypothetical protein